jgi:hypothetical protein
LDFGGNDDVDDDDDFIIYDRMTSWLQGCIRHDLSSCRQPQPVIWPKHQLPEKWSDRKGIKRRMIHKNWWNKSN